MADSDAETEYEKFFMHHTGGMSKPPQHEIYEGSDGHEWCKPNKLIKHDYCCRCLKIRRADKKNPPCKGRSHISLRQTEPAWYRDGGTLLHIDRGPQYTDIGPLEGPCKTE